MDTWVGQMSDPVTLNKYLYGNADPVRYTDPTGRMPIGELMAVLQTSTNLVSTAIRVVSVVDKVDTAMSLLIAMKDYQRIISSGVLTRSLKDGFKQSSDKVKSVDVDSAIDSLIRMSPSVTIASLSAWSGFMTRHASRVDRFVIYLPQAPIPVSTEIPFMKVRGYKVNFVIDNKGAGRLSGVGVGLKGERSPHQLWRMDYHKPHESKNESKGRLYAIDGAFHYHVNNSPSK